MVLGFVTSNALIAWQDKPRYLPQFHFHERHQTIITTAYPERILPAIAQYDTGQDWLISAFMSLRQLPHKLSRRPDCATVEPFSLRNFTLLTNTPEELCYGLRGQFWRADFGLETVPDVDAYCAPLPLGSAKLLMRYQLQALGGDRYRLCTETFIQCPERSTQLKMAGYWLAIRAASGLIRQRVLKGVKRQIETVKD